MFGINGWEALVLLLLVLLLVGPDRLPAVAAQVARWLRSARDFLRGARVAVQREIGDDVDLASLDPRKYDPRRVVREALWDEPVARGGQKQARSPRMWESETGGHGSHPGTSSAPAPFDDDAT